jgi:serine protease inhibitor
MRALLLLVAGTLVLIGCAETEPNDDAVDNQPDGTVSSDDSAANTIQPPDEDVDSSIAASSTNSFGIDMHQGLVELGPDQNVISSPFSAAVFLSMLFEGAGDENREAIRDVLQLEEGFDEDVIPSFQALAAELINADPDVEVNVSNVFWANNQFDFEFREDYREAMQERLNASIEEADLGSQEAADRIDEWVSEQTQDRIQGVADDLSLPDPQTQLVLANALYFLGDWTEPFEPDETTPGTFTRPDGETVDTEMMNENRMFEFAIRDDFDMLRLPYGEEERFVMDLILPSEESDIAEFSQSFSLDDWSEAGAELREQPVDASIPKFELEYDTERHLPGLLSDLGIDIAFDERADFSGMSPQATWLGDVVQKTFIRVDEEGTEAAAVTAGDMPVSEHPTFILDRPFMFTISDTHTNTLIFMGQVTDPSE